MNTYYSKYNNLFKTIFGSKNNVKITKKFLEDILKINIKDEKQIKFLDKEIISSDYIPNQKAPIVDINIEIKNFDTTTNNNNNNSNSGNELSKKIIIEMQVYDNTDFLNRIVYTTSKSYGNLYKSGEEFKETYQIYSLNIVYNKVFKSRKEDQKYFYDISYNDPTTKFANFPNIHLIFIDLSNFNLDEMDEEDNRNLWIGFFKLITFKYEKNDDKKTKDEPETEKDLINPLTKDIYNKLIKVDEIKEVLDICRIDKNKIKIDKKRYGHYVKIRNLSEEIKILNEEYKRLKSFLENEIEENPNLKEEYEKFFNENYPNKKIKL